MTKSEEKDLLQALKKDSYFCYTFGTEVIDEMCKAIDDDMLFEGILISKQRHEDTVNAYKQDLKDLAAAHQQELKDMHDAIAYDLLRADYVNPTITNFAIQRFGLTEVIKFKIEEGIMYFTEEEKEYLKSLL